MALAIWDTAGQEKYRSFTRQYFRGASAAVLLYDITSAASFDGVQRWLSELEAELQPSGAENGSGGAGSVAASAVVVLVGCKSDRRGERQVSEAAAHELAARAGAEHLECSSKDGTNCEAVFEMVGRRLVERGFAHSEGETQPDPLLRLDEKVIVRRVGSVSCCM